MNAFEPAAAFVVRLVGVLAGARPAGALLESGWLINVNVPVPYSRVRGVRIVGLEWESTFDVVWTATPGASDGERVAVPELAPARHRDATRAGDTSAFRAGYVTLSFITTDLGRRPTEMPRIAATLGRLTP